MCLKEFYIANRSQYDFRKETRRCALVSFLIIPWPFSISDQCLQGIQRCIPMNSTITGRHFDSYCTILEVVNTSGYYYSNYRGFYRTSNQYCAEYNLVHDILPALHSCGIPQGRITIISACNLFPCIVCQGIIQNYKLTWIPWYESVDMDEFKRILDTTQAITLSPFFNDVYILLKWLRTYMYNCN